MKSSSGGNRPTFEASAFTMKPLGIVDPRVCECGLKDTMVASGVAWMCTQSGKCHVICERCVDSRSNPKRCKTHPGSRPVFIGEFARDILRVDKRPVTPYLPKNVSYLDPSTRYQEFRASVIGGSDWSFVVRASGDRSYNTIAKLFESIGGSSYDIPQNKIFLCSSGIDQTVLLYDKLSYFTCKMTYHFSSVEKNCKLILRPYTWLPETEAIYTLRITVTPGDFVYEAHIHPLRFVPEIRIPRGSVPQPPKGFFTHSISYTISQYKP